MARVMVILPILEVELVIRTVSCTEIIREVDISLEILKEVDIPV
jgi:hypothetical protein